MKKRLCLLWAVITAIAFIPSATVNGEPLNALLEAIRSAVADQLVTAGLTVPTVAQLSKAILKHYQADTDQRVAIGKLYKNLHGPQADFERELTELFELLYREQMPKELQKYLGRVKNQGGVKLAQGLRPLRGSVVKAIPFQIIVEQVSAVTDAKITIPGDDTACWDAQFDAYVDALSKYFGVEWNKRDLAARTLELFTGVAMEKIESDPLEVSRRLLIESIQRLFDQTYKERERTTPLPVPGISDKALQGISSENFKHFFNAALRRVAGEYSVNPCLPSYPIKSLDQVPDNLVKGLVDATVMGSNREEVSEDYWDGRVDSLMKSFIRNLLGGAGEWSELDILARVVSAYTGLTMEEVKEGKSEAEVKAAIAEATRGLGEAYGHLLNAALRRARSYMKIVKPYLLKQSELEEQIKDLTQEVERLKGQGSQLATPWTLVVVLGLTIVVLAGIVWRQRRRQRT